MARNKEHLTGRPKPRRDRENTHITSLFQGAHYFHGTLLNAILLDDLPVMQHIELLSGILASVQHDCLFTAWVISEESCHIKDFVTNDDPTILVGVVLGDFIRRVSHDVDVKKHTKTDAKPK